ERAERLSERRHTRCVALREPRRQSVEEQVDCPCRLLWRRCDLRGFGKLADAGFAAEAAGEHRRGYRLEMRLASHRSIERFEAPGRIEQLGRGVAPTRAFESDLRAQPFQPGTLELVEWGKRGGREQLERRVRRPGIDLGLGGR